MRASTLCLGSLLSLLAVVDVRGNKMYCGGNVTLCGVLTLETGLGSGVYHHDFPSVHGLWPETGSYGTSKCEAPTESTALAAGVYSCYSRANGGDTTSILSFENHEWTKHGRCAGCKTVTDFFQQVCELSSKPLAIMKGKGSLQTASDAIKAAGYEIFSTDFRNAQLSLSTCFNHQSGKWVLSAVADFPRYCGSKGVHRSSPTSGSHHSSGTSYTHHSNARTCVPNQHGPRCRDDMDCISHENCLRCAHSGFCTATPLSGGVDVVKGRHLRSAQ